MKRMRLIIAALALSTVTPALSGCAALTALGTVTQVADVVTQPVEIPLELRKHYLRLLTGAIGANALAEAAVDTGLLKPGSTQAIFVADRLKDLDAVVRAARIAYNLKDARTLEQKVEAGNDLLDVINPYIAR